MVIASPAVPQFFHGIGTAQAVLGTAMIVPKMAREVAASTSLATQDDRAILAE
jgi:hypothetical protein